MATKWNKAVSVKKLAIYSMIERVLSRRRLWKLGRFLYQGARRELMNHPEHNGEYALFDWLKPHWRQIAGPLRFVDIGANFGDWSVRLIETLGREAERTEVIAFEPAPAQAERALSNLSMNAQGATVSLERSAVAEEAGSVDFEVTGADTGNSGIATSTDSPSQTRISVPCVTLDSFVETRWDGDIALIKVDTEGNDFNVIKGAAGLFDGRRIELMQFEYNWRWIAFRNTLQDVFQFLKGRDYALGVLTRQGVEIHDSWHPELERYFETNFLIVRRDLVGTLPARAMRMGRDNVPVAA